MATSRRRELLNALVERLQAIQDGAQNAQGATFETDAGALVEIGDTIELGADDPDDCLLVVPGDATKRSDGQKKVVDFLIEIQALVKVGVDNAWARVEVMLSDIERAIETPDRRLADQPLEWMSTRTLQREPGSTTAGVGVTYRTTFQQTWGMP